MPGPLAGIKVVDVSQVVSGPLAVMVLADQGADVIKVEQHDCQEDPDGQGDDVPQDVGPRGSHHDREV